jgi:hypothetical protein
LALSLLQQQQQQQARGIAVSSGSNPSSALLAQALAQQQYQQQQQQQHGMQGILTNPAAVLAAQAFGLQGTSITDAPPSNVESSTCTSQTAAQASQGFAASAQGSSTAAAAEQEAIGMTGRPPVAIYISCDDDSLSEYQCLVRKQIELFEAGLEDVESNAQGRNKPIVLGQVGIRCRHCTMLPPKNRARGAIYYPAKLHGIYQAAQNMASGHLCEHCQHVPADIRSELLKLHYRKSSAGGGKKYWADGVRVLGVYEDNNGLRFEKR